LSSAFLIRLGFPHQYLHAIFGELQVLDSQRSEFRAPECGSEAHQHKRAVAQAKESGW
jgi:hypothetical protein